MTTERDLIRRLARKLDRYRQVLRDDRTLTDELADEARAYLAQSEPEGPTDEPLGDLIDEWVQEAFRKKPYGCKHPTHAYVASKAFEHGRNHAARTALSQPEPKEPTDEELNAMLYYEFTTSTGHGESSDPIGFARAALARWGRPAVQPPAKPSHNTAQHGSQL